MPVKAPIRRLSNGRYQATHENARAGVPRTRRNFETKEQAREWLAQMSSGAHARFLGHRERRLFGEALTKYLQEESPAKKTHTDDLSNARALRWPVWDQERKTWVRLELLPLEGPKGTQTILQGMALWRTDMRAVQRRAYVGGEIYHHRPDGWWWQPDPDDGSLPAPRSRVQDPSLLGSLETTKGRGPFSGATLRIRQVLVTTVLSCAHRRWDWTDQDLSGRILYEQPAPGRVSYLTPDQVRDLVIQAPVGLDLLWLAMAWIGWRRANVEGLTWDRVVWPTFEVGPDGSQGREVAPGYLVVPRQQVKQARRDLVLPMSSGVYQLMQVAWKGRFPGSVQVFHRGDGSPWGDHKRAWASACQRAGLPEGLRVHDLRHTWATSMVMAGASDRELQETAGWADPRMAQRYSHYQLGQLRAAVEKPHSNRGSK